MGRSYLGRKRLFTVLEEVNICQSYLSGKSLSQVAKIYGTTRQTISRIVKRGGNQTRPRGGPNNVRDKDGLK